MSVTNSISSGGTYKLTHIINRDKSVRFHPIPPVGHENTKFAFGYDAKIVFESGKQLSLPNTYTNALLLSNEIERIEHAETNEYGFGHLWLRKEVVRPAYDGISGTAIAGGESRFYIHEDGIIVSQYLKNINILVKPNTHTRYAQGFIKRFGGIDEAMILMRTGGVGIISALTTRRAHQSGFYGSQIFSFLKEQRKVQEPSKVIAEHLPQLLSAGLVRRGYALQCPSCDLKDWYSLDEVRETVTCNGCAEVFQLPLLKLEFSYKGNELAARFVETGGQAVLMTAEVCYRINRSSLIQFGGDLLHKGEKTPFAEVDLFWFTFDIFAIAECKSYEEISGSELQQIEESLKIKIQDVAVPLQVQVILLGVLTNSDVPDLFTMVARASQEAKDKGIALHLILNGAVHLWGARESTPFGEFRIEQLLITEELPITKNDIGEHPTQYSFGGRMDALDEQILLSWAQQFKKLV